MFIANHLSTLNLRFLIFSMLLLIGFCPSSRAQSVQLLHKCSHSCSHARIYTSEIGIYPQDQRVHDYDVHFYALDLEINPASTWLTGSLRMAATVVRQTQWIILELVNELNVSGVIYHDQQTSFFRELNTVVIDLGQIIEPGTIIDLQIFYSGQPQTSGFFSGIQSGRNSFGENVLWTLSEPHNARQWFPVKQVLEDKADSAWVFITVPQGYMAGSNGLLTQVTELSGGRQRYEWKTYYPIAYYLISIAVAQYQEYNFYAHLPHSGDSLLIQNYIYNHAQVLESQRANLERTRDFMWIFSLYWGDYPFATEKYGHAQAPMGGAMEHQTMSTMGSFGFDITAHELAHHWFGNHVTCATWSDIWINEGFASYGEYMAREFLIGRENADAWMHNAHNNIKSEPTGSVFVPPFELGDVRRIFNGRLTYRKGAAILHQLRFEINDDALFYKVMEDFQQAYAHSVATGDDFRRSAEETTGMPWQWFFDQWYYGEGHPTYNILWKQQDDELIIRSAQTTSANVPAFFAGTLEFKVITPDDEFSVRVFQNQPVQEFSIPVSDRIEELVFDPDNYMLMFYTLAKFSDQDTATHLSVAPNPFFDNIQISSGSLWLQSRIQINDLHGRIVYRGKLASPTATVNITDLNQGIYLISFFAPSGEKRTFKLLKQ